MAYPNIFVAAAAVAAGMAFAGIAPAFAEQETTVYVQGTVQLDNGKISGTGGFSQQQTHGNTTQKIDLNVNTKKELNVSGSQTTKK